MKFQLLILTIVTALVSCNNVNTEQIQAAKIMNEDIANKNKNTARAFFQALESEDTDQIVSLFAENAKHINPYASGLFPNGATGKDEIRDYWFPVFPNFDGMQFLLEYLYATEDPNFIFVKYTGRIKLKNDAGYYENNYYSTFKFDDEGLISEYVEIFNPIVAARGFGMIDQIK